MFPVWELKSAFMKERETASSASKFADFTVQIKIPVGELLSETAV